MTTVRLARTVHRRAGAPVVVMGVSLGSSRSMWMPQIAALRERFSLVVYAHRGHDGSDVPDGPYSLDQLGADVVAMLAELGIARASHCGLSLGGMVALWIAANRPELVDRVALCCTTAYFGPDAGYAERARRVRAAGTEAEVAASLARWFTPSFRERAKDTVAAAAGWLRDTPREGYAGCCEALHTMDLRAALSHVIAPTLILAGAEDAATPPANAEAMAAAIPRASLAIIRGAAHLANLEQPDAVTSAVLAHLAPD
jgi:3-oxoadipate enol-lactonase